MVTATLKQSLSPSSDCKDETLVAAARSGDRTAYAVLVDRYRDIAFAYAYARFHNREEAEDIAQETFVRAYLALDQFRSNACWGAWVMRILRNLCHDRLRRQRVRQTEPLNVDWQDRAKTPEIQTLENEGRRELNCAIAELPDKYRVPLVMYYATRCTYRDIALALDLPESTVTGRLAGALRLLRRRLCGRME